MTERTATYLALGAGVQSSTVLYLSCKGLLDVPRVDFAVFADTGDEPRAVYDYLEKVLRPFAAAHGVPVLIAKHDSGKTLSDWVVGRQRQGKHFVTVPLYTKNDHGEREGMLRRQCTREFKLEPITQAVRRHLGYKARQRVRHKVTALLGISIDEALRMKPSRVPWITNRFPLVDGGITRAQCLRIMEEAGFPRPSRSACVYCPYRSDLEWQRMKDDTPQEFARAVAFDEAIRNMTMRGLEAPGFVHRSCTPLAEVDFEPNRDQTDLFTNECEGMCGV